MSVPARRQSKTRVRIRRSHHGVTAKNVTTCKNCKAPIMSHLACKECGFYGGKQVLDVDRKKARLMRRAEEKLRKAAPKDEDDSKKTAPDQKQALPADDKKGKSTASQGGKAQNTTRTTNK